MNTKTSKVISFRVPVDLANQVEKQAKKEKKKRAELVESLFVPAFQQHVESKNIEKRAA